VEESWLMALKPAGVVHPLPEPKGDQAYQLGPVTETSGSFMPPASFQRILGDAVCAICLDPLRGRANTLAVCGHIFHRSCLNSCGGSLCPQCRCPIDGQHMLEPLADSHSAHTSTEQRYLPLLVGTQVRLCDLRNHTSLNGVVGSVVQQLDNNRYEVRVFETRQLFRVRRENLCAISADSGPGRGSNTDVLHESTPSTWETPPQGLVNANAGAVNRSDNAEDFEVGMTVQLVGLQRARRYNGQAAEVVSNDLLRGCCQIRLLDDGSVKVVRHANMVPVARQTIQSL